MRIRIKEEMKITKLNPENDTIIKTKMIPMAELRLTVSKKISKEGANKWGNSSRLTQSFHFFMFEPIFSPVNALNQPI